jgi:hypothetical protein
MCEVLHKNNKYKYRLWALQAFLQDTLLSEHQLIFL